MHYVEQHLEDEHGDCRRPEQQDYRRFDAEGEHDFDGVEAQSGGHIDIQIGMVDHVQPPEQRNRVKDHVLEIDGQVQQDDRSQHGQPLRYCKNMEQAPAP